MSDDPADYEAQIPNLSRFHWERKSDPDPGYNCIAWAAGEKTRVWWPPLHFGSFEYWPAGVPAWETLAAFIQAFATIGFKPCERADLEIGFEKVAIYVSERSGKPTHAARQLKSGRWTSKLGIGIDIEHEELEAVAGEEALAYGAVAAFLVRER